MKKNVFGRKLSRDKEERKALFKSLMSSLILKESIKTTESKAKAIKSEVERLITKAKELEKGSKLVLEKSLSKDAFDKIIKVVGPRFSKRQGGYTRIIKLGERFGDNSPLVMIELTEKEDKVALETAMALKKADKKVKKATKSVKKEEKPKKPKEIKKAIVKNKKK